MYILGVIEPVAVGQAAKDYLSRKVNPTLLKGLTHLCKQKPQDPVVGNEDRDRTCLKRTSIWRTFLKLEFALKSVVYHPKA